MTEALLVLMEVSGIEASRQAGVVAGQLIARKLLYGAPQEEIGLARANAAGVEQLLDLGRASLKHLFVLREALLYPKEVSTLFNPGKSFKQGISFLSRQSNPSRHLFYITEGQWEPSEAFSASEIGRMLVSEDLLLTVVLLSERVAASEELSRLKEILPQKVTLWGFAEAVESIGKLAVKPVRQACKFRGELELSPITRLRVQIQSKTVKRGFPSAQLRSARGQNVKRTQVYYDPSDPYMTALPEEKLSWAYRFGEETVLLHPEKQNALNIAEAKCLRMIAFVPEDRLPIWLSMSGVDCITADPEADPSHTSAFKALVEAMVRSGKAMLARFTPRNAAQPRFVGLHAKTDEGGAVLYLLELPTIEDIREFSIGSSQRATTEQCRLAAEVVRRMDLSALREGETGRPRELLVPEETPNPIVQAFNQRVLERGLAGPECPLPSTERLDPRVAALIFPEQATQAAVATLNNELRECFALSSQMAETPAAPAFWQELVREVPVRPKPDGEDSAPIRDVSERHPVSDFREMINNRNEDLVLRAVKQMQTRILAQLRRTDPHSDFEGVAECMSVLREGCLREGESDEYNEFLLRLRSRRDDFPSLGPFWRAVRRQGASLGPISLSEFEDSAFTAEAAAALVDEFEEEPSGKDSTS